MRRTRFRDVDRAVDKIVSGYINAGAPAVGSTLSHYTGEAGLRGILSSGTFWATSAAHMGDKDTDEMHHAEPLLVGVLNELRARYGQVIERAEGLRRAHTITEPGAVGIVCFTTETDSERHWDEHGQFRKRTAYRLEFRLLSEKKELDGTAHGVMRVRYDEGELRSAVRGAVAEVLKWNGSNSKAGGLCANGIARILDTAAVTFKRKSDYEWERETRLVALMDTKRDLWKRPEGRRPYLEAPIRAAGKLPDIASVLIRGVGADIGSTTVFLRELGYGRPEQPQMPSVGLSKYQSSP